VSAPFYEYGLLGEQAVRWIAVGIGVAFGFALERAGLGNARKLTGQFLLTDLTVFKVMFTAIVTAMLGLYWLGRLGAIDLARVYVPETWLVPQLVGGIVFGLGFAVSGLCPGTSCVAASTGRGDGFAVVAGMFSGVLATGLAMAPLIPLYRATPRGSVTLPALLHLPYGVVVLAVVAIALGGFRVAQWLEKRATDATASGDRVPLQVAPSHGTRTIVELTR
jgi:uncharacterized membrane protein YedE/YeeE